MVLFFDLILAGTVSSLVHEVKLSGSSDVNITLVLAPNLVDTNVVRVILNGSNEITQRAFTPTTFELYSGLTKIYSFMLDKWFIAKKGKVTPAVVNLFCNSLNGGYRMAKASELTNDSWKTVYKRQIGGGLFAEWGNTGDAYYTTSNFEQDVGYWASESYSGNTQFYVLATNGYLFHNYRYNYYMSICIND